MSLRELAEAVAFTQVKAPDWLPVDTTALDALREYLASPTAPREGLDVERLALAIAGGDADDLDVKDEWYTTPRMLAETIAREYARLSE